MKYNLTYEQCKLILSKARNRAEHLEKQIDKFIADGYNDGREMGFNEPCATWIGEAEQTYEVINNLQEQLDQYPS